jgi:AcrR family transcriptional regulator
VAATTTARKTAEERREEILDSALTEFARHGYEGASTDAIARAAGISQPYLFRLFRTKKELFIAAEERCFADTAETFRLVSENLRGDEALAAMGDAYKELIKRDPRRLRAQMQAYAASDEPEIGESVRRGFGRLVELVESKGVPPERAAAFFAAGMLINVLSLLSLFESHEPWARRLVDGSMSQPWR